MPLNICVYCACQAEINDSKFALLHLEALGFLLEKKPFPEHLFRKFGPERVNVVLHVVNAFSQSSLPVLGPTGLHLYMLACSWSSGFGL